METNGMSLSDTLSLSPTKKIGEAVSTENPLMGQFLYDICMIDEYDFH